MDKKQVLEMILSMQPDELAKAVKDAKGLEGIRIIKDLWEDEHHMGLPARDDTKTGPAMHSSGSGADKAIAEYSHPAPQVGHTMQYDEFTQKNIEGWGKMHEAFKSLGDKIEAFMKKAEEEKKEEEKKEHEMKSPDPDPDPDPKHKSPDPDPDPDPKMKASVSTMWDALGELEEAFSKAEEHEEKEEEKKEHYEEMEKARISIEKAEKVLESEGAAQQVMKAQVFINLGWKSLMKATGLGRYDLHGIGNQSDTQIPGDSTKDQTKTDYKEAKAKAQYYALKTKSMEKALGIKSDVAPAAEPVAAAPAVAAPAVEVKSPDPDPDPDPKHKAEIEALKAEVEKAQEFAKATNERVAELNKRIESVTGRTMVPMTPVFVKSAGIKNGAAASINDKIDAAQEAGILDDEDAGCARALVDRYAAANRGVGLTVDIVNQQLSKASTEVRNFFDQLSQSA